MIYLYQIRFDFYQKKGAIQNEPPSWRVEGALREFPTFPPLNLWFDYPTHRVDDIGSLKDVEPDGERPPWQKAMEKRKDPEVKKQDRKNSIETAFEACSMNEIVTTDSLAEYLGISSRSVWRRLQEHAHTEGGFPLTLVDG